MKRLIVAIAIAFAALVALAAILVLSGRYDVSADRPHWAFTESLLGTLRDRSIEAAAADIVVPALDDPKMVSAGALQYAEMCAGCHLSPVSRDSDTRRGLYPQPPDFYRQRSAPRRAFWVTKHGLKMTGMPAWGRTHDDRAIWNIVALLQKLPELDGNAYRRMVAEAQGASGGVSAHSHGK